MEQSGDFNIALGYALKALATSEKFSQEVVQLLRKNGVEESTIDQVLVHLQGKNLLNDRRCAELAINRLTQGKPIGRSKIKEKLLARGAPEELITELLPDQDSQETIQQALSKKFPHGTTPPKAARYLYSRGFQEEEIESVLQNLTIGSD